MARHVNRGFSLIELLVVVTIIALLLALLMPAMDRAIYQAELAVCGARLKALGTGVNVYAMDFKRYYPYRDWVFTGGWRPNHLWNRTAGAFDKDERPMIRPYVAGINKQVQCPFNKEMDIDPATSGPTNAGAESNQGWGSYYLLYGWGYHVGKNFEKSMRRMGDRFEQTTTGTNMQSIIDAFDILACDYDAFPTANMPTVGSHPDQGPNAAMYPYVLDNQSTVTGTDLPGTNITISRWTTGPSRTRATLDMNFAHADGSVLRLTDLVFQTPSGNPDERVAKVFESANKDASGYFAHLPPVN